MMAAGAQPGFIEWAAAGAPAPGEIESGDRAVVVASESFAVCAVIDGLGHGPEAALAARIAATVIQESGDAVPTRVIERCHDALREARGAVMSVARLDARTATLTWAGVGNVEGFLLREGGSRASIPLRAGIVGHAYRSLREADAPLRRGDLLLMATDGIRRELASHVDEDAPAEQVARDVLERCARGNDDACVLVVRSLVGEDVPLAIHVRDESDVATARIRVRELARAEGLSATDTEALATAVSEIARNVLVHAKGGVVQISAVAEAGRRGVVVVAKDDGPGIEDPRLALEDGFTTGSGLGLGLPGARRLVDEFSLESKRGGGTTVTLKKWRA